MRCLPCDENLEKRCRQLVAAFAVWGMLAALIPSAWGLITGGEGNKPIHDPGWPEGAAAVFNTEHRVAYWEGPPFGGGQWHAECRGDTSDLESILEDFSGIDTPRKRVVVHDGVGRSFWLNPNREKEKEEKARIDWAFTVWQADRLKFQQRLPVGVGAVEKKDDPILVQIDVYTGGGIDWDKINRPEGIEIVDQRLAVHGFTLEDGTVLEGKVIDLATQRPLAATLVLEKVEPRQRAGEIMLKSPTGKAMVQAPSFVQLLDDYPYTTLKVVKTDAHGHWVLKHVPQESCRLLLTADGYVPRVIGHGNYDGQPHWSEHNAGLSKPGAVTGRVVDHEGKPLDDVNVRLDRFVVENGGGYQLPQEAAVKTDVDGRFEFAGLPLGSTTVWLQKPGYIRPGLGMKIEIPSSDVRLEMQLAARLQVTVDFTASKRPKSYIVEVKPEGGEQVGKWSGSSNIDDADQVFYENIPPGKYVITGRPNPGNVKETTGPVTVNLEGGEVTEVTLPAK